MKPTTHFKSRYEFKKMLSGSEIFGEKIAFISISDNQREENEMIELIEQSHNKREYITLSFADNEADFSSKDASELVKFIDGHHDHTFIVHCFAGVSRSGAVAKFINEYLDRGEWYLEDYQGHNRHVFNQLHRVTGTSLLSYYEELEKEERGF